MSASLFPTLHVQLLNIYTLTLFVLVVVVVRDIARLVGDDIVWHAVTEHIPNTRPSALCLHCTLNLVGSPSNTIPKISWEAPAFILLLERYLLAIGKGRVVE